MTVELLIAFAVILIVTGIAVGIGHAVSKSGKKPIPPSPPSPDCNLSFTDGKKMTGIAFRYATGPSNMTSENAVFYDAVTDNVFTPAKQGDICNGLGTFSGSVIDPSWCVQLAQPGGPEVSIIQDKNTVYKMNLVNGVYLSKTLIMPKQGGGNIGVILAIYPQDCNFPYKTRSKRNQNA